MRTWITNVPRVDSGWQSMMRDFDAAVKRYDRDPLVRVPSTGSHATLLCLKPLCLFSNFLSYLKHENHTKRKGLRFRPLE